MLSTHVAKNIRRVREKRSITQEELSQKIKCCPSNVAKYEKEMIPITLDILDKICKALHVSVHSMLRGADDQKKT